MRAYPEGNTLLLTADNPADQALLEEWSRKVGKPAATQSKGNGVTGLTLAFANGS